MYGQNKRASQYRKEKLIELEGKTDKSTIRVRHFNIPLPVMVPVEASKTGKSVNTTIDDLS